MNSKDFFLARLKSGLITDTVDISQMQERSPFDFIKEEINGAIGKTTLDNGHELKINYLYSPDTNFDYCTMASCQHDGSYCFILETIQNCLNRILRLSTYYTEKTHPELCDEITYTFGNLLIFDEYRPDLAPENKKWMAQRTTVYLPIKYEPIKITP